MSFTTPASASSRSPDCCGTTAAPALALELLQQVGLQVGATRDLEDLEEREQRHVVIVRIGEADEVRER